ncbi:52 kDa repressor of the inhibitor of the protein kinase-like [Leptinotarsa decemlineata]|uniref:52 kDa repressor of the inhibitor of the protein kinase-like n=1 Tax=Leptinotarsa decemlineata TaxID=7539 RepID=UPI003D308CC1
MPGYYCVFRGCSARTGKGTSIFRFPQDCERAKVWLEACRRHDLLPKIDSLHKNYRICERHFENITIVPPSKCSFVKNANDEMPSFYLTVDGPSTFREVGLQNVSTCSVNVE